MKLAAILGLLIAVPLACGQAVIVSGNAGLNADSPYNRLYNPRSVVTFKGTVAGIQVDAPMSGVGKVVALLVKADNGGTALVDLGPEWFVNNQRTQIKMGDRVQVTGSKVIVNQRGVILAEMVVKKKDVLSLRRPNGRPYWDAVSVTADLLPASPDNFPVVSGQILRVDTFNDGTVGPSERILVHTDDRDVWVDLGPTWFMQRQPLVVGPGDMVQISTFPVSSGSDLPHIGDSMAATLSRGSQWMILRNVNGRPVWFPADGG
jgi:hypothetical protein